jgi:hypothetical protein
MFFQVNHDMKRFRNMVINNNCVISGSLYNFISENKMVLVITLCNSLPNLDCGMVSRVKQKKIENLRKNNDKVCT